MSASSRRLVPITLAAAVAITAAGLWAYQPANGQPDQPAPDRPRQPGGRPGGPGERPNVEQSMRMMNRGVNQLKASLADPAKKEESLAAVWMIQRGCLGAKAGKPEHVQGDAAQTLDAFRRGQIKLMGMLLDLETAVMDGKNDAARALLAKVAEHPGCQPRGPWRR